MDKNVSVSLSLALIEQCIAQKHLIKLNNIDKNTDFRCKTAELKLRNLVQS